MISSLSCRSTVMNYAIGAKQKPYLSTLKYLSVVQRGKKL